MKQFYIPLATVLLFFSLQTTHAQCTCANGILPDSVVQTRNLYGILSFSTPITFDQFDQTLGALTCISTTTKITTILNMDLVNRDSGSRVTYQMDYNRITSLSGPGLYISSSQYRNYGPFDLGQATVDADTAVHIGPDTLFNGIILKKNTFNVVPYIGAGTVTLNYFNNGSYLMTQGNDNFGLDVAALSTVDIRMVYYICPTLLLETGINQFMLKQMNDKIWIGWKSENETPTTQFIVEMSTDGIQFQPVFTKYSQGEGSHSYNYYMPVDKTITTYYFRIRQSNQEAADILSPIKYLKINNGTHTVMHIFPNPVKDKIQIQFNHPQSGQLKIELVNAVGQTVQETKQSAFNLNVLQINLRNDLPKGQYWLRMQNVQTKEVATTTVMIL